jgi:hypothetical protein
MSEALEPNALPQVLSCDPNPIEAFRSTMNYTHKNKVILRPRQLGNIDGGNEALIRRLSSLRILVTKVLLDNALLPCEAPVLPHRIIGSIVRAAKQELRGTGTLPSRSLVTRILFRILFFLRVQRGVMRSVSKDRLLLSSVPAFTDLSINGRNATLPRI